MFLKTEKTLTESFSADVIDAVWEKGTVIDGKDPAEYRRDVCRSIIQRSHYGVTSQKTGWEVDHIQPKAKGGTNELDNLQPLQWENNRSKGDNYPEWDCACSA
jgi:5-methylcytosine-specific restriction endonuclease McrA